MGNFLRWLAPERSFRPLRPDSTTLMVDDFGVVWQTNELNRGYIVKHPLEKPDLSGYSLPRYDYATKLAHLPEAIRKSRDCFIVCWIGDLFERANFLRGLDNFLVDLKLHPAFAHELLDRLEGLVHQNIDAICQYDVDGLFLSDDYGLQCGLMMNPATWREFIKPRLARIFAHCHKHGKKAFLHSCGDVEEIIPDLIETDLDVLHPIQPEAMDVVKLKARYGRSLCLYGGVSTQDWLIRLEPDELKRKLRALAQKLSRGSGYILAPGITLQYDISDANLMAFIEVAREYGTNPEVANEA